VSTKKPTRPNRLEDVDVDVDVDVELDGPARFELPPGADPTIDWGLTSHLDADGKPRIIERHLLVPPELAGLRLDHFVKTQIGRLSRTKIQDIDAQLTRSDGKRPKSSTALARATLRDPQARGATLPAHVHGGPRGCAGPRDRQAGAAPVHASAVSTRSPACSPSAIPTSPSSRSCTASIARPRAAS
jgi:hypothetical protein